MTSVEDAADMLVRYNPFLTAQESDNVLACVMLLMMLANRISLANLVIQQARNLFRMLNTLQKGTSPNPDRLIKELLSLADTLAATLTMKRHFIDQSKNPGFFDLDPRFLLFEYCHGLLLRQPQVQLVRKLIGDMNEGRSVCHQMIMGAGKTTVVGPLLAMLLADSNTLVMEVVPPALLEFSAGVLREKFGSAIRKPVFTFQFDRYKTVTPQLLLKLVTARSLRAVVVASPTSIKSFMLKFIEICHILNRQLYVTDEKNLVHEHEKSKMTRLKKISRFLGFGKNRFGYEGVLTPAEITFLKEQATISEEIFSLFNQTVEIMDEVDILLHPLKSELNWPLGRKEPLDFTLSPAGTGLRWAIPSHLLDAIFSCVGMPIVADIADSKQAAAILTELTQVMEKGFDALHLQRSPHMVLLSRDFYE